MIIQPDFLDHHKVHHLLSLTGQKENDSAVNMLLRLWAYCQRQKSWRFTVSQSQLAGICRSRFTGAETEAFLIESGFIYRDGKEITVHQWEEHNRALVSAWNNGAKGAKLGYPTGNRPVTDRGSDRSPTGNRQASNNDGPINNRQATDRGGDRIPTGNPPVTDRETDRLARAPASEKNKNKNKIRRPPRPVTDRIPTGSASDSASVADAPTPPLDSTDDQVSEQNPSPPADPGPNPTRDQFDSDSEYAAAVSEHERADFAFRLATDSPEQRAQAKNALQALREKLKRPTHGSATQRQP